MIIREIWKKNMHEMRSQTKEVAALFLQFSPLRNVKESDATETGAVIRQKVA